MIGDSGRRASRETAYTEFVEARQAQLRRVAYALCGDWHKADDLLQTALVKLYVAWPRISRNGSPDAYVRTIIVRTNIDLHRRATVRPERLGIDDLDPTRMPSTAGPAPEERSALIDALQELPEMQRKVVVLRHWLDLSVAETAAELKISEGTVKSHAHRGLERLRGVLAEV